jgi:acetoin utilization deacetylase AcuC-like enzyme
MRIVYDPGHQRHRPRTEILYGKPLGHPDVAERVEAIRRAISASTWEAHVVPPRSYPLSLAERVHEAAYVTHLQERCAEAAATGPTEEWFPYVWPRDRAMDTGTPLMGVSLDAAWAAACCALTAADLILHGEPSAFALCRPPGHHAAAGSTGGYCYLNNAALAAAHLLDRQETTGKGIAILDLDIHHGNGTQSIFYRSDRVLYCSLHGHPDWAYPPHTGLEAERGEGAGVGFTYNQPLPERTAWPDYAAALDRALERTAAFSPAAVVVSQGFDTFEGDRWGGFLLHAEDYARIGERLRTLGAPIVSVLEGGYEPAHLAAGTLALLDGLAA